MVKIDRNKIKGGNDYWGAPALPIRGQSNSTNPNYTGELRARRLILPVKPSLPRLRSFLPVLRPTYSPLLLNRIKKKINHNKFHINYPKLKRIKHRELSKVKGSSIFSITNPIKSKQSSFINPFMIGNKNQFANIKRKDLRWPQAMSNPKLKGLNPFGDADKDGVLNMFDCRPFDFNRQEDLPKGEERSESMKRIGAKRISEKEFNEDPHGLSREESAARKEARDLKRRENIKTEMQINRTKRLALDLEQINKEAEEKEKWRKRTNIAEIELQKQSQKEYEKTQRAKYGSKSNKEKEKTKQIKILTKHDKQIRDQAIKDRNKEIKARIKIARLEAKREKPKWGTLESLGRTRETLKTKREGWGAEITKVKDKIEESKINRKLKEEKLLLYAVEKDPEKKKTIKEDMEKLTTLSTAEERRLKTDIAYKEMKKERATKGRAVLGDIEESKKKWAIRREKMGLGWAPGAYSATKERLKAGFSRLNKDTVKRGRVYAQRATGLIAGLTSTGGMMGVEGNIMTGGRVRGPIEVNPFEAAAIQQEEMDKAHYRAQAEEARKAGRPYGSFKYGMPIAEYKAMQANLRRQEAIQMAMAQAQKAAAMQVQTDAIMSGGAAPQQLSSTTTDYSRYQITQPQSQQQTIQQQSYPGAVINEPSAALGSSIPQYNSAYDSQAPINLTQGGPMNLAQANRNIVEREWSGYDMPTRSTANKSMTTTQLHAMPNIYGDANPDPRYARMPTLPVDPAMIREDDLPREYYVNEEQANSVALASEQQYRPDVNRGNNESMQGDVPIIYAAKKKDLRAPTVKSMVLQTQNDGQRKMAPVIKANPWGLQLKNRINFSENNILESDLKGNVISKDQIGGQILKAPNVFKNEATFNYNPARNPSPLGGNRNPSSTGLIAQPQTISQADQIRRRQAMQLAQMQNTEAKQPSFFQRLSTGMPLRPQRSPPRPIARSMPQKKASIFDKIKRVVGGVATAEEQAQEQSLAEEQQYIDQTQIAQAQQIEPAGVAQPSQPEQEVAINMTEEEFNNLSVADQQKVIEASQSQQVQQEQQQMSEEEQANLDALSQEEYMMHQRQPLTTKNYDSQDRGEFITPPPNVGPRANQQPIPGRRGGSGFN